LRQLRLKKAMIMLVKPLALLDLDDTLFQTAKHLPADQLKHVASHNSAGAPLGWMTDRQQQFWQWLQASTEVIPVTARSLDGLARVQLPLHSWAVCQHGAVIVQPDGQLEPTWHAHMQQVLTPLLPELQQMLSDIQSDPHRPDSVRAWIAVEQDLSIYIIIKQLPDAPYFAQFMAKMTEYPDFYLHINGNTAALLPNVVSKVAAVQHVLSILNPNQQRVVLGWGDSLSDVAFLQQCDWWGMPQRSQASAWVDHQLTTYVAQTGAYDFAGR
jgi:hydroxymethylpyrimidine pyrophosphatase-like HAD family hydrolase